MFDDLEPAADDSVAAVDQSSHQSLVGVPGKSGLALTLPLIWQLSCLLELPLWAEEGSHSHIIHCTTTGLYPWALSLSGKGTYSPA